MGYASRVSSPAPAHVVNARLWAKIREDLRQERGPWSAYKSGQLVARYKAAGGTFRGPKPSGGLTRWFRERWVDVSRPKPGGGFAPCGRASVESGKYPLCRPLSIAKRIAQNDPALVKRLVAAKRAGKRVRFPAKYEVKP